MQIIPPGSYPFSRVCQHPDCPGLRVPSDGHGRELPHQDSVSFFYFLAGGGEKKGIILLIMPKAILFSHKCRVSFPLSHSSAPRPQRLLSPECLPPPSASASCPPLALFELSLLPVFPTLTQLI